MNKDEFSSVEASSVVNTWDQSLRSRSSGRMAKSPATFVRLLKLGFRREVGHSAVSVGASSYDDD